MADELRHETLSTTVADGTTTANSAAEFRNDSSRDMQIRIIEEDIAYHDAENNERGTSEISKSPVFASNTNNNVFFARGTTVSCRGGTTGAALDDVSQSKQRGRTFGLRQLTLEPNESLFVNVAKSSGGALISSYQISYHF